MTWYYPHNKTYTNGMLTLILSGLLNYNMTEKCDAKLGANP